MLFDGDDAVCTLEPEALEYLRGSGEIDFPRITEKEIQDRSKGDALSKGLVVIQTGWFLLQCIARKVERLPITELEVATLAFATLNFATYALWWHKPLNVQRPFRVLRKQQKGASEGEGADKNANPDENDEMIEMWMKSGTCSNLKLLTQLHGKDPPRPCFQWWT